jgi:hypothetical protein
MVGSRRAVAAQALVWALLLPAHALAAQAAATATVGGVVRDTTEAVIAGASVQLRNHDTNQTLSTTTDGQGRYRLPYVPVGDYHLTVNAPGFATSNVNLTLGVGQAIDVPVTLKPGITESIDVVTTPPLVEAGRTEVSSRVTPAEVDSLPLNGRNYLDLALLAPNVSRTILRTTDRFAETSAVPGSGVSVAGQRNLSNDFVVDGLSANDDAADLAGVYLSEEVVREFEVVTSGGGAEFGRASSGTISVVTQSGTNRLKGRAYEFFRNDAFDTANPLATRKDPLNQNQYGFTLGGPIVKDRSFWFGNVERTQQDRTGIVTIAPSAVTTIDATLDASGYRGPRVATGNYPTGYTTNNVFGRVDQQAGSGHLEVRYGLYDVSSQNARNAGGLSDVSRGAALDDTDQTVAVNYLSARASGTINEARAQYTRSRLGAPVNDLVGPAVSISGVANFGTATSSPTERDVDVVQAVDRLTLQRGAHLVKSGVDLLYNRVTIAFPGALQGSYTFTSLQNFQRGTYSQFQQAFGEASQFQSNPNLGVFTQDEWRPRGDLSLNFGVRYDLQWLPSPIRVDTNNVSPRIGAAYAPGDGKTVVRASAGLYFDRIPLRATSNALQRDGSKYKTAVLAPGQPGAPVWPAVLPSFPAGVLVSIQTIDPSIQDSRTEQASIQLERALGHVAAATVGYSYLRGHGIIMSRNVNVPTLTPAQAAALGIPNLGRPNPNFGNITEYDSIGDSWFNGLTAALQTRPAAWGDARVSYTLAQALDDAGNAFFNAPQDNFNVLGDKGPSDNDQRHRLVVSGSFRRWPSSGVAAIDRSLHGVELGYVWSYASGAPFTVLAGADLNNDTNTNDRPAGVGRNSERLPSTSSFDLRLSRAFSTSGGRRLEAMIEAFNLFNHVNVLNVNSTFGTGSTPLATFNQPIAAGDMRQLQLGIRWTF